MDISPTGFYRLHPAVAIEDFGDRSLILHCEDLRLVEINVTARELLRRLEGRAQQLDAVAAALAALYDQPVAVVLADAQEVIAQMLELDIVQPAEREYDAVG